MVNAEDRKTYVLLPLAETSLLGLDLLRETLAQSLLLLLELRIIKLLNLPLPKLARLHLLLPIILIMNLLRSRDEIQHESANQQRAKLLEIAVRFVFDFGYAPEVFATFDDAAVGRLNVFGGADYGEGHGFG